ncbi:hypothetical protein SYNTR_1058 [Candidatus Syntrophocurvum alkaliphilum]|uniref:Uncharacterized protein n=1 Tax=Candidatus Syntrophocurvum alkaliphilum TaxID=2293317 RepID=A0A6I6DJU7_9FIRM|nr:YlzJ-like family protein [Candidatus Syntrophocurvum alkaliphilum]QGT99651.1 hypothetical protein SYNTR_1058 [Candidatus Syntrophocurvum alkaliphilum]
MIVYTPNPFELMDSSEKDKKAVTVKLPSGGVMNVEPIEYNSVRVLEINSTDPGDFLNTNYQPGNIITLDFQVK